MSERASDIPPGTRIWLVCKVRDEDKLWSSVQGVVRAYTGMPGDKVQVELDGYAHCKWHDRARCHRGLSEAVADRDRINSRPPEATPSPPALGHSGEKYVRKIRSCRDRKVIGEVDVYSVADAFPLTMPRAHALKKILCAGLRDKGSAAQDVREAIDALKEDLKELEADA